MKKVRLVDATLRDGMHAVSHQLSPEDMYEIAKGLNDAGVDTIEVGHGDGLAGSTVQYGFAKASDEEYLKAVVSAVTDTKVSVLLIPGIGTKKDLKKAADIGIKVVRVATHCTEADTAEQHIKYAKELGLEAIGFLMMSHMISKDEILEQAKLFESYGADAVYVTDSSGAMLPDEVTEKISHVVKNISVPVGFHSHNNLGLAVGNSLAAFEAGASYIDGTAKGMGAGAGNTQTEVLAAVFNKAEVETGIDLYKIMDVAEDIIGPKLVRPQIIDKPALTIGWAGVYGSFLLFAKREAKKYGLDPREVLIGVSELKAVGGQEDLIIEVAYNLAKEKGLL